MKNILEFVDVPTSGMAVAVTKVAVPSSTLPVLVPITCDSTNAAVVSTLVTISLSDKAPIFVAPVEPISVEVGKISCVAASETATLEGVVWFIAESYKQLSDAI